MASLLWCSITIIFVVSERRHVRLTHWGVWGSVLLDEPARQGIPSYSASSFTMLKAAGAYVNFVYVHPC